eukprot:824680-Pyramimonas_sp.AAC.1
MLLIGCAWGSHLGQEAEGARSVEFVAQFALEEKVRGRYDCAVASQEGSAPVHVRERNLLRQRE